MTTDIETLIGDGDADHLEYHIWRENGVFRGWVSEPFCNTHDGDPYLTDEEAKEWEEGGDPCQVVMKILNI